MQHFCVNEQHFCLVSQLHRIQTEAPLNDPKKSRSAWLLFCSQLQMETQCSELSGSMLTEPVK